MIVYTAEDFAQANLATKGRFDVARRTDPSLAHQWHVYGGRQGYFSDEEMAADGWVPVMESRITEGTLALAFEQRTQTLLAVATATFADGSAMFPAQIDSARRQIADRLGLGGAGRAQPLPRGDGTVNWDEQSDRAAIRYYSDWCPDGIQEAHRRGARWMREALLSDDAVERAARAMDENFNPDKYPIMAAMFRDYAKTALTAAIGGDDE